MINRYFILLSLLVFAQALHAQCTYDLVLNLVSLNFEAGCDFTDGGGIDAAIEIYDLNGNLLLENEVENLNQVTGPGNNVPFNLSTNPDCCDNGYSQSLGEYSPSTTTVSLVVLIFDNDGGCCNGYQSNTDDNFGQQTLELNIFEETGTLFVGSCISFNYTLTLIPLGESEYVLDGTACAEFELQAGPDLYNADNPSGTTILPGGAFGGCDSIITVDLEFTNPIEAAITGEDLICPGDMANLTVDTEFVSYFWEHGDVGQSIMVDTAGTFTVVAVDQFDCPTTLQYTVGYLPNSDPTVDGDLRFCEGESTTLTLADNFVSYDWSTGDVSNSITVDETGTYTVDVVTLDGCMFELVMFCEEVIIAPANIIADPIFCYDTEHLLELDQNYFLTEWSTEETTDEIIVTESGEYFVTVTNNVGCSDSTSIILQQLDEYVEFDTLFTCEPSEVGSETELVFSPEGCVGRRIVSTELYAEIPEFQIDNSHNIVNGDTLLLSLDIDPDDVVSIAWYEEDVLLCEGCFEVQVMPGIPTIYTVVFNFHEECELREIVDVKVASIKDVYIPNIFSPGNDFNNDRFQVFGPDLAFIHEFLIYDRWGNLIFKSSGLDAFWDGTFNNANIENGVYAYYLDVEFFDGIQQILVGDITLIR